MKRLEKESTFFFFVFHLSGLGESVLFIASDSCSWLEAEPDVICCCCKLVHVKLRFAVILFALTMFVKVS